MAGNSNELEKLKEKLAAIEHERWADWQKYVHSIAKVTPTSLNIPLGYASRWDKQIDTSYSELSEREKQSYRAKVDRYWHLIEALISSEREAAMREAMDALYWMYLQYCSDGHDFMGAGETASELLEKAGYLEVDGAGRVTKEYGDSEERNLKELSQPTKKRPCSEVHPDNPAEHGGHV